MARPLPSGTEKQPLAHVLVVEDEPDVADVLALILEHAGYAAVLAPSIAAAREALAGQPDVDVALLDVGLPDGDGLEFCAELKRLRPDLAVLVMTAYLALEPSARKAGADGFLQKPFELDVLVLAVAGLVRRRAGRGHP